MLSKLIERIAAEANISPEQSERVVDIVLTEVKGKLPAGFQRNFVAVMNGERDFNVMDNFGGVLGTESHAGANEGEGSKAEQWKQKISQTLGNLKSKNN